MRLDRKINVSRIPSSDPTVGKAAKAIDFEVLVEYMRVHSPFTGSGLGEELIDELCLRILSHIRNNNERTARGTSIDTHTHT